MEQTNKVTFLTFLGIAKNLAAIGGSELDPAMKILADMHVMDGEPGTVAELCTALRTAINESGCHNKGLEVKLLTVLHRFFPMANLPLSTTKGGNAKSLIDKLIKAKYRYLSFHICPNGCTVYVGSKENDLQCNICHQPRCRPCGISPCNRSAPATENCKHPPSERLALCTMQVRPIIPLIVSLIRTEGFLNFINYENLDLFGDSQHRYFSDISNSNGYIRAKNDMRRNWERVSDQFLDWNIVSVPLLASFFYDGVQVHKSKVTPFEPLIMQILNLPPPLRGKMEIGSFPVALVTYSYNKINGGVKDFVFRDCIIPELESLHEGYLMKIDGAYYLIQMRIVMHLFDTKAMESALKIETSTNLSGCNLCSDGIRGIHRKRLHKVCFPGHRQYLPRNNYLRYYGQSGNVYQRNYYTDKENEIVQTDTLPPTTTNGRVKMKPNRFELWKENDKIKMKQALTNMSDAEIDDLCNYLTSPEAADWQWSHAEFCEADVSQFNRRYRFRPLENAPYYHHYELGPQKEHKRMQQEEYLDKAFEAQDLHRAAVNILLKKKILICFPNHYKHFFLT